MAHAGIHGLVGMVVQKLFPARAWLMLGILLGSLLPDADNVFVAVATVMKKSTEGCTALSPTACSSQWR